jgi:hypothetical protein
MVAVRPSYIQDAGFIKVNSALKGLINTMGCTPQNTYVNIIKIG